MAENVQLPLIGASEYTESSRVLHSGPCIVRCVHVSNTAASAGYCKVYDGVNDSGRLKAFIEIWNTSSYQWLPGDGTDFDYGIYVEVSSSDIRVTATSPGRSLFRAG